MKKVLIISGLVLLSSSVFSQVFNTGTLLKRGAFSVGLEPAIHIDGGANGFIMFFHGGYGITRGVDVGLKFGAGPSNYFGADLEWRLMKNISLTTGVHDFYDFGLDGTLNIAIPIRNDAHLFTGFDMDLVFAENVQVPVWIPLGVELGIASRLSFILESEIGLNPEAYHVIGMGVNFYF
ncbi:MAG: hypothetical protein ACOCXD_02700 [Bacteroidota bacterium]